VFLISDDQLKENSWFEDISGILNSGVVPNLFLKDEYEEVLQSVTPDAQKAQKVRLHACL
jgi:dynein heavy chain